MGSELFALIGGTLSGTTIGSALMLLPAKQADGQHFYRAELLRLQVEELLCEKNQRASVRERGIVPGDFAVEIGACEVAKL